MTSSGVPVGDTTLLQRLKELDDGNPSFNVANFPRYALPAVVTLIEAAQRVMDDGVEVEDGLLLADTTNVLALAAALAPFVGEATQ